MTNKYKPLITSFLPSLNLNGDPLSLDESNFSPSVNVPISLIKKYYMQQQKTCVTQCLFPRNFVFYSCLGVAVVVIVWY